MPVLEDILVRNFSNPTIASGIKELMISILQNKEGRTIDGGEEPRMFAAHTLRLFDDERVRGMLRNISRDEEETDIDMAIGSKFPQEILGLDLSRIARHSLDYSLSHSKSKTSSSGEEAVYLQELFERPEQFKGAVFDLDGVITSNAIYRNR
jgi:hypothetical protein